MFNWSCLTSQRSSKPVSLPSTGSWRLHHWRKVLALTLRQCKNTKIHMHIWKHGGLVHIYVWARGDFWNFAEKKTSTLKILQRKVTTFAFEPRSSSKRVRLVHPPSSKPEKLHFAVYIDSNICVRKNMSSLSLSVLAPCGLWPICMWDHPISNPPSGIQLLCNSGGILHNMHNAPSDRSRTLLALRYHQTG